VEQNTVMALKHAARRGGGGKLVLEGTAADRRPQALVASYLGEEPPGREVALPPRRVADLRRG
jgi:hypothetical protein